MGDPVSTSDRAGAAGVAALEQRLLERIGERRYDVWFAQNARFRWDNDLLLVGVPNRFIQEWLHKTFNDDVRAAAADVVDRPVEVRFAIDPELFRAARRAQEEAGSRLPTLEREAPKREAKPRPAGASATVRARGSRRWHRLADFVVGPGNRVAHASALSAAEAPGQGANPLVWHGPVGTGKTHLLEGLYAALRKNQPDWRVCFVTAEDFTNRFVQALRLGKLGAFRRHFRECDALLVDDLHFLIGKKASHEEFQHTFDALQREGRQLVLTCDCHPRLNDDFSPELADRLIGGAVWGLTPPDAPTRLAILQTKAARQVGPPLPEAVLRLLADSLRGNVRELEGALTSLRHYSLVTNRPVDLALAREALADLLRHAVRVVRLPDVDGAVCRVLQLPASALQSKARTWAVSHPRMLAMFVARKHTAASYSEVGAFFGGRNHSTAVAAEKKVRQWLRDDGVVAQGDRSLRVREILERIERELAR
jgi:chromosomal replication initiator protein